ncbi:MAG: protein-L-isoaspartate(D-aspartate) O-methyltransferase [Desulfonatronovibrio sp.]
MKDYTMERNRMVEEQLVPRGITDPRVLNAMRSVPRHRFVEAGQEDIAYSDQPLPIGQQQTISQPYIVALMTQALELKPEDRVLEIGTGSGYQAAVLAELAHTVYTIEKIEPLLEQARTVLKALGYDNVISKLHNGTQGWPQHAPYNAIMVTAGAPEVPRPLLEQMEEGGRMVIPVGDQTLQEMLKVTRKNGNVQMEKIGGCRFVPLRGEHGW